MTSDATLAGLGFDADLARWGEALGASVRIGRVVRVDRGFCVVLTSDGVGQAETGVRHYVVTGDWVGVDDEDRIFDVSPRRGTISRADPSHPGVPQVLAANVDYMFVVCGADRPLRPGRIERALALAWEGGADPVIVLTKGDMDGAEEMGDEAAAAAPGVAVHLTSSVTGLGLSGLTDLLEGWRTAALLGESGAGKSTLANRLAGVDVLATAAVREGDAKGRHTTTARHLIPLPGGGALIDTPGLRAIGLPGGGDALAAVFADIEALAPDCRFSDCQHRSEPGCAVQAAVADGRMSARRLAGFEKLKREAERADGAVAAHEQRAQNRQFGKMAREAQQAKRQNRRER